MTSPSRGLKGLRAKDISDVEPFENGRWMVGW